MTGPDPAQAREQAWKAYDAAQRALPDCEHVREWQERVSAARKAHHAAVRACDKAAQEEDQ